MNAKRSLRGVFIAAAAAVAVILISAIFTGNVSAKPSEPELEMGRSSVRGAERELRGTLAAVDDSSLTVGELTIQLNAATEVKGVLKVGDWVKVHVTQQADGTYLAREVETTASLGSGLDDNSSQLEPGDDHGNHPEPGDDHGNQPEPGDDHGGKSGKDK